MDLLQQEMADRYPKQKLKITDALTVDCSSGTQKWKSALLLTIVFLLISSPFLYKAVDGLIAMITKSEGLIADFYGQPTKIGMAVHAVVFFLLVRMLLR
jgi:hypothetical protein